jgi:hypothetical protein
VTFEDGLAELRRLNKTSDELSERLEATRSAQTNLYLEMNSEDRKRHWVANKGEWVYLARAEAAADADAELLVYFAEAAWPKELASGARWDNDKWSSFEDDADRQVTSAEFLEALASDERLLSEYPEVAAELQEYVWELKRGPEKKPLDLFDWARQEE